MRMGSRAGKGREPLPPELPPFSLALLGFTVKWRVRRPCRRAWTLAPTGPGVTAC